MPTIRNKTEKPLRVPLPRGKTLHLGPRMSGQVAASAVEHKALTAMVEAGTLEIVADDEGGAQQRGPGGGKLRSKGAVDAPFAGTSSHRSGDRSG